MDIVEIAKVAREALKDAEQKFGARAHVAIMGILQGFIDGNITRGSRLLGEILLGPNNGSEITTFSDETPTGYQVNQKELNAISSIFSSGMCSEGEPIKAKTNWVER